MTTQFGFTSFTPAEFEAWFAGVSISRSVDKIQQHHTWLPNYANFNGSNHFTMQRNMQHHHVANNGWSDIGQHFSIFPDGVVLTGRPLNATPACIFGNNARSICIESVGDFDIGKDQMRAEQRAAIIAVTRAILARISGIPHNDRGIVYHHWFDLNTGARTNGAGNTKSCPGTAYFGGNTVAAFNASFLPLVLGQAVVVAAAAVPLRLVAVTAARLNIRGGPGAGFAMVSDNGPAEMGAILRVWDEADGWLKISNSKAHWVSGRFCEAVRKGRINTRDTNGRAGPGLAFGVSEVFARDTEVFARASEGGWARVGPLVWVKDSLITPV